MTSSSAKLSGTGRTLLRLTAGVITVLVSAAQADFQVKATSFLGGANDSDAVRASVVQSDGSIVLGANISDAKPGNLAPVLLNGAVATSSGAVVRLSSDGTRVLSVTRLGKRVTDLATDGSDNIYVALWDEGIAKLNPAATSVVWKKDAASSVMAMRIDAGRTGYCSVLGAVTGTDPFGTGYEVRTFDPSGTLLGQVGGGRWKYDVCIDEASASVVFLGFRNASAFDGTKTYPVQISYVKAVTYAGVDKYTLYDWSTDQASDRFINKPTNNMADTRGYRAVIGRDGKLYCGFECAGGNHIFRYSPIDIMTTVALAGGDKYHQFYNSKSEHKTVIGRYEPATGAYLAAQQFCARLTTGAANAFRISDGNIAADELGRLYVAAQAGSGGGTEKTELGLPYTFNPTVLAGIYGGGGSLLIMSPDLKTRLFVGRTGATAAHGIDSRLVNGKQIAIFSGSAQTAQPFYAQSPIQPSSGGGVSDGFIMALEGDNAVALDRDRLPGTRGPARIPLVRAIPGGFAVNAAFGATFAQIMTPDGKVLRQWSSSGEPGSALTYLSLQSIRPTGAFVVRLRNERTQTVGATAVRN